MLPFLAPMTSAWPQLDELIRELSEIVALPNADGEPSLTEATIAVTKATTALARAAQTRGRNAEPALSQALVTVEEARALLRQARMAISASASPSAAVTASSAAAAQSHGARPVRSDLRGMRPRASSCATERSRPPRSSRSR